MTDKQINVFGTPSMDNPQLTLTALVTDMAVIKVATTDTNRRLETLERILAEVQALGRALATTQATTQEHERRLGVVETRAESIDKNIDEIALHAKRLESLECDLIKNGEYRMAALESTKTWAIGAVGTALTGGLGWFVVTYIVPLIKH